jgi:hypothetical protein
VRSRARRDGVRFELATRADDAEIRRLLRENPMPGRISISLEREPDASLAAAVEGDVHHTIIARDPIGGSLLAMGSVSVRDAYINGDVTRLGYLGQLRLDHRYRPRAQIVIAGYRMFRELHESLGGVRLYLTSIAADNFRARRLLERGLPDMPTYRPLDTFVTTMIEAWAPGGKPPPGLHTERVSPEHMAEILDFLARNGRRGQFTPVWRDRDLRARMETEEMEFVVAKRRERVVGCIAVWDQSSYKQAVIRGYGPRLLRWRRWINAVPGVFNIPRLPPVGTKLNMAYLSHVAVDDDDRDVFAALLGCACDPGDRRGDDLGHRYFVLGLSERHPLLRAIPRTFRAHTYHTNLYVVHWDDGRAEAESLDGRICQPEVALL